MSSRVLVVGGDEDTASLLHSVQGAATLRRIGLFEDGHGTAMDGRWMFDVEPFLKHDHWSGGAQLLRLCFTVGE